MGVGDEDSIDAPEPVLWKPLDGRRLKALADINDDGPGTELSALVSDRMARMTYFFSPSVPRMRITTEVFRCGSG